jgi:molecular chaperone IbpA
MFNKQFNDEWDKDPHKARGKANPHDPNGIWPGPKPNKPWVKESDPDIQKFYGTPQGQKGITIADLFPRLDRLSIGWSPLLEQLKEVTQNKPSYPPYDIVALKDANYDVNLLNVAVAGFTKKEISITLQDSVLTIKGEKEDKQRGEVLYQGIATRDFKLELAVAEYWEITNARLENGMLTIQFNKELPEEKKPKVIDIN